jgi:ubiquinone/menaquinone biosynthesis C-methylase UbiE
VEDLHGSPGTVRLVIQKLAKRHDWQRQRLNPAARRGQVQMTQLERLRRAELESVSGWFEPGDRVLELGAGSGYQASLLAARGCEVTALDLPDRPHQLETHYPVQEYDGRTIPVPDESVDVVFSSHVLEHVYPLAALLEDTRRVMKPGGLAVHVLPTSTWRIWTSLAHYPFVLKMLLAGPAADSLVDMTSTGDAIRRHGALTATYKTLVHPFVAHGSHRNAIAEVRAFGKTRWRTLFARSGFAVVRALPTGLFYTGYGVLGGVSIEQRHRMSWLLGSSSCAFVLQKTDLDSRTSDDAIRAS